MSARTALAALASTLACGVTTMPAAAADFGISFHYESSRPRYCAVSTPYYSTCAPRAYVNYNDYYYNPVSYVDCSTPRVVVYDDCYPTTYRRTYTRSRYYTGPVRHLRAETHYRSGLRICHDRKRTVYRRHYTKPSRSIRVYHGDRVSRFHPRILRYSHRDMYRRHPSPYRSVRIHRW